ncbi:MAG: DUF4139 domain-containing protein [Sphingobacteriia bacterium]|nr:DUF4139 domain-containing protein [Sphingobacteriia bacterium]NCC37847.1 DUF4139 domain-containing protein [Gammaproteobacteria bacterium]
MGSRHLAWSGALLLGSLLTSLSAGAAVDQEQRIDESAQKALAITIYNADLALVKDQRRIRLGQGEHRLAWRNVSERIRPETALLSETSGRIEVELIEQSFDFDLLTPESLLRKYVGRTVQVIRTNEDGDRTLEDAVILAANAGPVLRYADRIETIIDGHLAFPDVPEDLRDQPTLVLHLRTPSGGDGLYELAYLTSGLAWKADYVADLATDGSFMDLNGWVTLTNESGIAYRQAQIQLVAGEVNQVEQPRPMPDKLMRAMPMATSSMPEQESLAEYHLYTLPHRTDLLHNQTKQVALLSAPRIPVSRELVVRGGPGGDRSSAADGWSKLPVTASLSFANRDGSLGIPLPKGVIRVYAKDRRGNAQFVGEDAIDHTPKNETLTVRLGESFDVTARRRQIQFTKLGGASAYDYTYEAAYELELKNAKDAPVTVKVLENIHGDWMMIDESHPHDKASSSLASWQIEVPAEGSATLSWRLRVRH